MESRCVTVQVCYALSCGIHDRGHLPCDIVDGHRYADDPEPSWYSGGNQYARPAEPDLPVGSPYDSGVHERPSGAFRLPEQRPAYTLSDPVTSTGSHAARTAEPQTRIPVRGPEYPTIRPTSDVAAPAARPAAVPAPAPTPAPAPAPVAEPQTAIAGPTSLVPPITTGRVPESVYQSRRPVTAFLVAFVMVVLMVPVVRLLVEATFTGDPSARAIVPAVLLTLGFTLTGIGLFAVARGGPITRETWLRPPVAYLPAGLLLLLAAGVAGARTGR